MLHFSQLVAAYGYWAVAGALVLENAGVPLPGETILIAAAIFAGATHQMSAWILIAVASAAAILGATGGFWLGRQIGYPLLVRYGHYVWLTEPRIKLGHYLFLRQGAKLAFFGRYLPIVHPLVAFLAGANRMHWPRFALATSSGAIVWASAYGLGAYYFGEAAERIAAPLTIAVGVITLGFAVVAFVFMRRHEAELQERADRALPGPLRPLHRRRQKPA